MSTPLDFDTELAYRRERLTARSTRSAGPTRSTWFPLPLRRGRATAPRDPGGPVR